MVTPKSGGYTDVRVRAALYEVNEEYPNGFSEAIPTVEVEVADQDHWISVDNTIKATHAEAGVGGLAIVRATRLTALLQDLNALTVQPLTLKYFIIMVHLGVCGHAG